MSGTSYDVVDPATEQVVTTVPLADVELEAFAGAVTDWERFRGFERL